jgi:hypothetical protein
MFFSLWQLKLCPKSNDKSVYSKFQILSLVDFDINISVTLLHVNNIGSVLNTLFTLRSSPFITADFICFGGGCACGFICCSAGCSLTPHRLRLSTGLFNGSSCSPTLPPYTCPLIRGRALPLLTPLPLGIFYQRSNILGYKVSSLVIIK